jgi:hypothetical protein
MKNVRILMMIMGFAVVSACASNDTTDAAESDASAKAEMMKQEQAAAMEKEKAEAEAQAQADMKAKADEAAEQASEQAEEDVDTAAMKASDAAKSSGDLASTCNNGDQVRVIRVVYDNPNTDYVCEVTYEKSTGVETLWFALNERDYCLDKATAFVEKQEGWGWTCSNLE